MSVLDDIILAKRESLKQEKRQSSLADLQQQVVLCSPTYGFARAITNKVKTGVPALIAEIKKGSPSKGLIRKQFDPANHAKAYQQGGACCLSVLTDPHFLATNDDFSRARVACDLPMLRKDFIIDPWQVYQSRLLGADCILLILAVLSDSQADELYQCATECGLDVLVETHDLNEIRRARLLPETSMIGINNRNLHDFSTDISTTLNLVRQIPTDRIVVSESGIHKASDVQIVFEGGAQAVLVGESLMRRENIKKATRDLLGA